MSPSRPIPGLFPQRQDETWLGGWFLAPLWVRRGDEPPTKPWIPLWTSPGARIFVAGNLRSEPGSAEELFSLLDEVIREQGRRPGRIEIADLGLETLLRERLDGSGVEVVWREKLEGVDDALSLVAAQAGVPDMPGALEVPGVTLESMQSFAEAARDCYLAAPWRHLSKRDLIEVRGGAPPGFHYAVVLGMGQVMTGLGFFDNEHAFWHVMSGEASAENQWRLAYGPIEELPADDADLWVDRGLEVAGPDAYPCAFCVQSANRVKRPSPRVLDFLTGLLKVLAASGLTDFDEGRWSRTVDSIAGPREVELVLPLLLEPPSRADLERWRIRPERRAAERRHYLLQKYREDHPSANVDELSGLVGELVDKPLDEISYEPKDDRERAQELCFEAFEGWGRRRGQLIEQALALDPECVDALVLQAERTLEADEERRLYERAVKSGEKLLEDENPEDVQGDGWMYYPTRPYLRALHGLAHVLERVGKDVDVVADFRRLLELDEEDHQGVRYCLLTCLLTTGQFEEAERHIDDHESPEDCVWLYARALAAFGQYGDERMSQEALAQALEQNPFAAARLLEDDVPPAPDPELDDDADMCAGELVPVLSAIPGAFDWLADGIDNLVDD